MVARRRLYFVSDRSGWWNLYRGEDGAERLSPMEAEFGGPAWIFGMSTYAFDSPERSSALLPRTR